MLAKSFLKARRGAAITEFAFSSIIMIFVLMMTMEFGVEVFLRQQAERAAGAAATSYAETRSPSAAQDAAMEVMMRGFRGCVQPLDILLHNNISSIKNGSGRQAQGNASDNGAAVARVTLTCNWTRMTPVIRLMLGETMVHEAVSMVRIRG